ncbi:hypothetical protein ACS0TY_000510 [Phlomoides rotata]
MMLGAWSILIDFLFVIGLQVKQLLKKTKERHVTGLLELKNKFADRLDIHRLHLTNYTTIERKQQRMWKISMVDLYTTYWSSRQDIGHNRQASLLYSYEVNAIGPIIDKLPYFEHMIDTICKECPFCHGDL